MRPPVYRRGEVWWCRVASPSGGRAQRISTRCRDYQAAVDVWRQLERASVADPDRTARVAPVPEYARRWLALALQGAPRSGRLFAPWPNVRRDLAAAAARAGVPRCSPNDLRRTYGSLLRVAGVAPHLIGQAMGHADSRMVERVYGRLGADELARLIGEVVGVHREHTRDSKGQKRRANGRKRPD